MARRRHLFSMSNPVSYVVSIASKSILTCICVAAHAELTGAGADVSLVGTIEAHLVPKVSGINLEILGHILIGKSDQCWVELFERVCVGQRLRRFRHVSVDYRERRERHERGRSQDNALPWPSDGCGGASWD